MFAAGAVLNRCNQGQGSVGEPGAGLTTAWGDIQVMHMDLKAQTVLLTKTYSIAKIADVDTAQVMGSSTLQRPQAAIFAYAAPELILNGKCTEKVSMPVCTWASCKGFSEEGMHIGNSVLAGQTVLLSRSGLHSDPQECVKKVQYASCSPRCALIAILAKSMSLQVDMYSFGVILWELITTEVPRRGRLRGIKVRSQHCMHLPPVAAVHGLAA